MAARRHCSSSLWFSPLSSLFLPRGDLLVLIFILSLLLHHLTLSTVSAADSHFEGFHADDETLDDDSLHLIDLPLRSPTPPTITQSDTTEFDHGPPDQNPFSADSDIPSKPSMSSFEYWDEEEFEGLPVQHQPPENRKDHEYWRVRFEGFDRVREWISMAEELESESNTARTMKRSKAGRGGSQRRGIDVFREWESVDLEGLWCLVHRHG